MITDAFSVLITSSSFIPSIAATILLLRPKNMDQNALIWCSAHFHVRVEKLARQR